MAVYLKSSVSGNDKMYGCVKLSMVRICVAERRAEAQSDSSDFNVIPLSRWVHSADSKRIECGSSIGVESLYSR